MVTRGAGRASAEDRLAALIELKQAVADDKTAREDAAAARDRLRAAALAAIHEDLASVLHKAEG